MAGNLQSKVAALIDQGASDEEIIAMFNTRYPLRVKVAISIARDKSHNQPVRRKGPWPVSYVRSTGERVYRVGGAHDIPEGSLATFGFTP